MLEKAQSYIKQQIVEKSIQSDQLAHQLVLEIAKFLKPGVSESQAQQFSHQCFAEHGVAKLWHLPYVRFAQHTLLSFREKAEQDYTLQPQDIAFIDIGIVWDGVEGDRGVFEYPSIGCVFVIARLFPTMKREKENIANNEFFI